MIRAASGDQHGLPPAVVFAEPALGERAKLDASATHTVDAATGNRPVAEAEPVRHGTWQATIWFPRLLVGFLALVAAALRVPGVLWGLPASLHPDEWVITKGAMEMAAANSFEPPYFSRPDHLEMQLSTLLYRVYSQLVYGAPAENMFAKHPGTFLGLSRLVTVAFAVAAVLLAFAIGRRFGTATGLAAAFLFTFFGPFVENGSYATPDVPLTAVMLAVILASMRYVERPGWKDLVIGCALVALAVTLKYPGALGAVPVGVAIVVAAVRTQNWMRAFLHTVAAPAAFVVSIFIFSPVLITNFAEVKRQLLAQDGENGHLGADGLSWAGNLNYYMDSFTPWLGYVLMAAAAVGLAWCIRDRAAVALPLIIFGVAYWLAISALALHWARWGLPILVTPLILAAVGFGRTADWLSARHKARTPHTTRLVVAGLALSAVSAISIATGGVAAAAKFGATDTRIAALDTFDRLGITADNTVMDGYTPLMPQAPWTVANDVSVDDGLLRVHGHAGAQYVVVSSGMYPRYFADPKYAKEQEVYSALARLPVVARWDPATAGKRVVAEPTSIARAIRYIAEVANGGLAGPTVIVYRLPATG